MSRRTSGILLHPTSLPGTTGIGDLGVHSYEFVDFLRQSGQHLWQMLPLGPTGFDNSPYQTLSVFAGNEMLISLEKLVDEKLLAPEDLQAVPSLPANVVHFKAVNEFKSNMLKKSFEIFKKEATSANKAAFDSFCDDNRQWLEDYSLFRALKEYYSNAAWNAWDDSIRLRHKDAMKKWSKRLKNETLCFGYQQFQFFKQWTALRTYAGMNGIRLVGDMPIFVALDSAEVWSHPELFFLDSGGNPTVVAGVPPDYFSSTGQLWGNPLYRWEYIALNGYSWWIDRLKSMRKLVDIIRIDHFRGFEDYWEIPAGESTAINGRWVTGPGSNFFKAVKQKLGELPFIAEDLGIITKEVEKLRDDFGLPGMRVMQFGFGDDCETNIHRPANYPENCVAYTGTHDNDTTKGWFETYNPDATTISREAHEKEKMRALRYLGTDGKEINWDFIRAVFVSDADTVVVPLQDVLGLGSEARMNIPGKQGGNWGWRFTLELVTKKESERLLDLTCFSGR